MRIKVGDTWYDAKDVPICLQMDDNDLEAIKGMTRETSPQLKYAVYWESAAFKTVDEVKTWMST